MKRAIVRKALLVASLVMSAGSASAGKITVERVGWQLSLTLGDGFREVTPPDPRIVALWQRGTQNDPYQAHVQLGRMGLELPKTPLPHATFEKSARRAAEAAGTEVIDFRYQPFTWRNFELESITLHATRGGKPIVGISVVLPLEPEAVMVEIEGFASNEASLRSELEAIAASVDGKSSWLTDDERAAKWGDLVGSVVGVVLAAVVIFIAIRRTRT